MEIYFIVKIIIYSFLEHWKCLYTCIWIWIKFVGDEKLIILIVGMKVLFSEDTTFT